jgi:hypothetical protein
MERHRNQPLFAPCDGCGIPIIIYPSVFKWRDMSGGTYCDGLFTDRPDALHQHYRTTRPLDLVRIWARIERDRFDSPEYRE